jgi:hypothetical protein
LNKNAFLHDFMGQNLQSRRNFFAVNALRAKKIRLVLLTVAFSAPAGRAAVSDSTRWSATGWEENKFPPPRAVFMSNIFAEFFHPLKNALFGVARKVGF